MKTLHKPLAIIFALLALTLFAACSSDSDDGSISTSYLANGATWTASIADTDTSCGTFAFKFDRTVTVDIDLSGLAELETSELAEAFGITDMSNPMLNILPSILENFTYSGTGNYYIQDSEVDIEIEDTIEIEATIEIDSMKLDDLELDLDLLGIWLFEYESGLAGYIFVDVDAIPVLLPDGLEIPIPIKLTK